MPSPSHATAVSLMSTLAVKSALVDVVIPAFEKRTGLNVRCDFDPTNVLLHRVSRGARADVLIATRACVTGLAEARIVDPASVSALVRTGVGIAVAGQAAPVLVPGVDDLCRLLLDARSVAYSRTGASGVYFAALLERLGVAGRVNGRATIIDKGLTGECVARGDADVAIQQMSELAMVPGIRLLGPLPEEVQLYTDFDVAIFAAQAYSAPCVDLIDSLFSESARSAYARLGLTVL